MTQHFRSLVSTPRRLVAVVAAGIAVAAGTAGALAYWQASGSGSGSTSTTTAQPVTVVALTGGDAPSAALQPGGSADVILRLSNPNAYAVTLTAVTGGSPITADGAHPGCTTTGVSFANQNGLSISVPSGTSLVHLPGAASMSTASSSGCQGASFSIPVTLAVQK